MEENNYKVWDLVSKKWIGSDWRVYEPDKLPVEPHGDNFSFNDNEKVKYCQYIGFIDKNGKKIYKDDLVQNEAWFIGLVYFSINDLQWKMKSMDGTSSHTFSWYRDNDNHKLEVIGNINSEPHLLTQETWTI